MIGGVGKTLQNNNVVTMLNDMKGFCCLDLQCSVIFCFTLNFRQICLNLYPTLGIGSNSVRLHAQTPAHAEK